MKQRTNKKGQDKNTKYRVQSAFLLKKWGKFRSGVESLLLSQQLGFLFTGKER